MIVDRQYAYTTKGMLVSNSSPYHVLRTCQHLKLSTKNINPNSKEKQNNRFLKTKGININTILLLKQSFNVSADPI
jgi:hypothetical protein